MYVRERTGFTQMGRFLPAESGTHWKMENGIHKTNLKSQISQLIDNKPNYDQILR